MSDYMEEIKEDLKNNEKDYVFIHHPYEGWGIAIKVLRSGSELPISDYENLMIGLQKRITELEGKLDDKSK
jgi:hypothetical protein